MEEASRDLRNERNDSFYNLRRARPAAGPTHVDAELGSHEDQLGPQLGIPIIMANPDLFPETLLGRDGFGDII
ncbi:MAG: hypothetical protein QF672_03445, partial [SAR202 cluster bacterium]|nr:hypothetical protein [SAR202 cluster bacterium]